MPRIDLTTITESPTGANPYTLVLPATGSYAVGDLLFGYIVNNGGGTTIAQSGGSDWTVVAGQANTTNVRTVPVFKKATTTTETNPVFTVSTGTTSGIACVVKDVDATTQVEASSIAVAGSATSVERTAVNSASDNALAIFCYGQNSTTNQLRVESDKATALNANVNLFDDRHMQLAFRQLGAAGAVPSVTAYGSGSTNMQLWTVCIKNASGGSLMPFAKSGVTELAWYGSHNSSAGAITNSAASNFAGGATVNGIATSAVAPTFITSSTTLDWGYYTSYSGTEAASKWVGNYHSFTFPDLTGKVLSFEWLSEQSPSSAQLGADGHIVAFADASNNIVAYKIAPKATGAWIASQWERFTFEPGVTTAYWSSASAIDWTAVVGILYATHSNGTAGTKACRVRNLCLLDKATIVGGGANGFATWDAAYRALTSCGLYKIAFKQAANQYQFNCGVQVGDGAIPTYFKPSPQAFEMSPAYNVKTQPWWKVAADKFGVRILSSASDTSDFSACSMVTAQSATWIVDASSSPSAAYNFQSLLVVGFSPSWNAAVDMEGGTFKGGKTVTLAAAAAWDNFIISDTTSSNAALSVTATGVTLSAGTIDITGETVDYIFELGTSVLAIDMEDIVLTGSPVLDKAHILRTTGNVEITISGTTALGDVNVTSDGATWDIIAPALTQSVTLTGLSTTCRVQLYDTDASSELYNAEPGATSHTWTDSSPASAVRPIRLRITDYLGATAKVMVERNIGTCGITSGTEAISFNNEFSDDTDYNAHAAALGYNGADITDITIVDATDHVDFNFTAGGDYDARRIYMYMVYWLDTEAGIRDDFVFCSPLDPVNLPMQGVLFENVTSPQEIITFINAYVYDATTGRAKDLIVGDGINFAPDHVVQVVATVGGANIITGDIADVAAEVQAGLTSQGLTTTRAAKLDNLDQKVSRLLISTIATR